MYGLLRFRKSKPVSRSRLRQCIRPVGEQLVALALMGSARHRPNKAFSYVELLFLARLQRRGINASVICLLLANSKGIVRSSNCYVAAG